MLGMLVAVSGVRASVRARWMCSVRQSSAHLVTNTPILLRIK